MKADVKPDQRVGRRESILRLASLARPGKGLRAIASASSLLESRLAKYRRTKLVVGDPR